MSDRAAISTVERSYAQLLSLAVHEFRTPVSIVGGYLRMLHRDSDGPLTARQLKMIDEAEKSCARLVALIAEMSDIAKLDAGTAPVKQERLDLFPMVEEVAASVHESRDRDVQLQVRGDSAGALMTGDNARLRDAFTAFFRAILREQASASTVVVDRRLAAGADQASATIVVAEEQDVRRSYDAERIPLEEKKRGGLGLILPIARRVVELHGGSVWSPVLTDVADKAQRAIIVTFPLSEHSR